jgi:glutamine---fructose-6-phosphate transaminase (isomerizing)
LADSRPTSRLYESIHDQPAVLRETLASALPRIQRVTTVLAHARHVFLCGTGTNSHAAVVGEHLLRSAGVEAWATTNFDFVNYPRRLDRRDVAIVLSHTGTTTFGKAAIELAQDKGAYTIGISGVGSPMDGPEQVIAAGKKERSDTYTESYTATLAVLALMACEVGEANGIDMDATRTALEAMPETVAGLLAREGEIIPTAEALHRSGRLILAGAGPNAVTAREGALKVKESSFLVAEGFELETMLHGGLQAVEPGDVAVMIAAAGPALERTAGAIGALEIVGAETLTVADERAVPDLPGRDHLGVFTFPPMPEPLSPLPAVIPLQLLAAFTAHLRGTNPDNFRYDEPRYKQAIESLTL